MLLELYLLAQAHAVFSHARRSHTFEICSLRLVVAHPAEAERNVLISGATIRNHGHNTRQQWRSQDLLSSGA